MSNDDEKVIAVHPDTLSEADAVLFGQSGYGQGRELAHRILEVMHQSAERGAAQTAMEIILASYARQENMTPEQLNVWLRDFAHNVRTYARAKKIVVYPKTRH